MPDASWPKLLTKAWVLVAPAILLPEVASALRRAAVREEEVMHALEMLRERGAVQLMTVDSALANDAARLVATLGLRGCDAVYVALAASLNDELVTLDEDQRRRAEGIIPVRRP